MFEIITGVQQSAQKIVIYGVEGIGKTTFAAQFPEPVFIDVEDSSKHLDVKRLPKPTSWNMLIQQINHVKNNKICQTLIIDTLDKAEELCKQHVMQANNWSVIDSEGYGKKFVALQKEFGSLLNLLSDVCDVGINIVLVAHAVQRKVEEPDQLGQYDHYELKLEKRNGPLPKEWADAVLFAKFKNTIITDSKSNSKKATGGERKMYTTHNPAWDAKNRWELADELPFDYSQIAHVFARSEEPTKTETQPPKNEFLNQSQPDAAKQNFEREPQPTITSAIPVGIADLMKANQVSVDEIMQVIYTGGFMPEDTPVQNIPAELWGHLTTNWNNGVMNILNTQIRNF